LKRIAISISSGIIVIILSYLLSKDMQGATPLYTFVISMNFGLIAGILTHDALWATKNKNSALTKGSIKAGLIVGMATMIIGFSAFFGIDVICETNSAEKHMLKLLILATGWVGVVIGGLKKYLVVEPPKK
jgi:hypothetical protein